MRRQGSGVIQTFHNFASAVGMALMCSIVASATDLTGPEAPQLRHRDGDRLLRRRRMLAIGYPACQILMRGGKQEDLARLVSIGLTPTEQQQRQLPLATRAPTLATT